MPKNWKKRVSHTRQRRVAHTHTHFCDGFTPLKQPWPSQMERLPGTSRRKKYSWILHAYVGCHFPLSCSSVLVLAVLPAVLIPVPWIQLIEDVVFLHVFLGLRPSHPSKVDCQDSYGSRTWIPVFPHKVCNLLAGIGSSFFLHSRSTFSEPDKKCHFDFER